MAMMIDSLSLYPSTLPWKLAVIVGGHQYEQHLR